MKVAIIRTDLIGDFLLWLNSAKQIREHYPNSHITLICNQIYADLANNINYFDEVIALNCAQLRQLNFRVLLSSIKTVRKHHYDILICPMITRNNIVDLLSLFIRADYKVSTIADYTKYHQLKWVFNYVYDRLINIKLTNQHELELNQQFCNAVLGKSSTVGKLNIQTAFKQIPQSTLNPKKYILISLGSSNSYRNWSLDKFTQLLNIVPSAYTLVFIGGQHEQKLVAKIKDNLTKHSLIDLTGKTNLLELVPIILQSELLIGNESALVHLATLLDINTLSFMGGGYANRYLPYPNKFIKCKQFVFLKKLPCYNCKWHCKYPLQNGTTWKCIAEIQVRDVINVIEQLKFINSQNKDFAYKIIMI